MKKTTKKVAKKTAVKKTTAKLTGKKLAAVKAQFPAGVKVENTLKRGPYAGFYGYVTKVTPTGVYVDMPAAKWNPKTSQSESVIAKFNPKKLNIIGAVGVTEVPASTEVVG